MNLFDLFAVTLAGALALFLILRALVVVWLYDEPESDEFDAADWMGDFSIRRDKEGKGS